MATAATWLACAARASAEYGEVVRIDCEAKLRQGALGQTVEDWFGHLDERAAHFAHKVTMHRRCEMVRGRPVPEVGVHHHTKPLELLKIAIDSREVDIRRHLLDFGRQVLCRSVTR
jgi:hypothetical protein